MQKNFSNPLSHAQSPYLRKWANQPVHWQLWNQTNWAQAQSIDKPLLISIGVAGSAACDLMDASSFQDPLIADLMNKNFTCFKVDYAEHPVIGETAKKILQMLEQPMSWPLHLLCLPDGKPFAAGGYFPATDQGDGVIPWPQFLMRIANHFRRERAQLEDNAQSINKNLLHLCQPPAVDSPVRLSDLEKIASQWIHAYDPVQGGFGRSPKFHAANILNFLAGVAHQTSDQALAQTIHDLEAFTLEKMITGQLYDHQQGGFRRYCKDRSWQVPGVEKTLIDNARLMPIMARHYRQTQDVRFQKIVWGTIDFVEKNLNSLLGPYIASAQPDGELQPVDLYANALWGIGLSQTATILDCPSCWQKAISHYRIIKHAFCRDTVLNKIIYQNQTLAQTADFKDHAAWMLYTVYLKDHLPLEEAIDKLGLAEGFADTAPGYFEAHADKQPVIFRLKEWEDVPYPSGHALWLEAMAKIDRPNGQVECKKLVQAYSYYAQQAPAMAMDALAVIAHYNLFE